MRRVLWGRGAAVVCACVLATSVVIGLFGVSAALGASAVSPNPAPSPSIVSQLTDKQTMYSNTYRLSDGTYQAQIFAQPIRFKGAGGTWQDFNTSLVAAGAGVYQAASTPVAITIGTSGTGSAPAQLSARGYTVPVPFLDHPGPSPGLRRWKYAAAGEEPRISMEERENIPPAASHMTLNDGSGARRDSEKASRRP